MRTELSRIMKNPLYWLAPAAGLALRAVVAYLDSLYRGAQFWPLALDFWDKTGSVTLGFLILLVLTRTFSYDTETGVFPVINSTPRGRLPLLMARLLGGALALALAVTLLAGGNAGISLLMGGPAEAPDGWIGSFGISSMLALAGAEGLYTVSALVCDRAKNQPVAMCLCGPPFAAGYLINAAQVEPPEVFWLLKYGFFTELLRGRALRSLPLFWMGWYPLAMGALFCFVIRRRKENREL